MIACYISCWVSGAPRLVYGTVATPGVCLSAGFCYLEVNLVVTSERNRWKKDSLIWALGLCLLMMHDLWSSESSESRQDITKVITVHCLGTMNIDVKILHWIGENSDPLVALAGMLEDHQSKDILSMMNIGVVLPEHIGRTPHHFFFSMWGKRIFTIRIIQVPQRSTGLRSQFEIEAKWCKVQKRLFPIGLHCERSGCKMVDDVFWASQPLWNDMSISEFDLFSLVTFVKFRRAACLNYLIPI